MSVQFLLTQNEFELIDEALTSYLNDQNDGRGNTLLNRQAGRLLAKLDEVVDRPEPTHQQMLDQGYEMSGEGVWFKDETPDYSSPAVCAQIDMLAGDNRN